MNNAQPFVSVVTPVYNGAKYLAQCIESVLSQTYQNWEYIIVNNCSTDASLEIAEKYAATDQRIRVVSNSRFVNVIENHNIAFSLISRDSKYCKVVCADDWIYPECISRMVEIGEKYPSTAVVGAYTINRDGIMWVGLPPDRAVFSGYEVCRSHLFGGPKVMGPPTSVLYRSEFVRARNPFMPEIGPAGDEAAYYELLREWDVGFVHQILSFERIHDEALNTEQRRLNAFLLNSIVFLLQFGERYGTADEVKKRFGQLMDEYYSELVRVFLHRMPNGYWNYHKTRLKDVGLSIEPRRIAIAFTGKLLDLLLNPGSTCQKFLRAFKRQERSSFTVTKVSAEEQTS